jgi:hypothetical protein
MVLLGSRTSSSALKAFNTMLLVLVSHQKMTLAISPLLCKQMKTVFDMSLSCSTLVKTATHLSLALGSSSPPLSPHCRLLEPLSRTSMSMQQLKWFQLLVPPPQAVLEEVLLNEDRLTKKVSWQKLRLLLLRTNPRPRERGDARH